MFCKDIKQNVTFSGNVVNIGYVDFAEIVYISCNANNSGGTSFSPCGYFVGHAGGYEFIYKNSSATSLGMSVSGVHYDLNCKVKFNSGVTVKSARIFPIRFHFE